MHNPSMIYGYARVSSNGQDLAQQLAQLDAAGCTKVYREKVSAATAERPQLKRAIGALDAGDVLMVKSSLGLGFGKIVSALIDNYPPFADTEHQS